MSDSKANLFIVGAMKAGTTRLWQILQQHPDIYASPIKEPHFFVEKLPKSLYEPSPLFSIDRYFKKDFPKPLHIAHVRDEGHYQMLFEDGKGSDFRMEASTMYLQAPNAAKGIATYNPEAKIIILRRNPLERSWSHYRMLKGLSRETRAFEKALLEEVQQYERGSLLWHSYLGMSLYKDGITRFRKLFQDVLVIDFEDLNMNEAETLNKVFHFLKLEPVPYSKVGIVNQTRKIKYKWLFYILKKLGFKVIFSAIFGSGFKQKIFMSVSSSEKPNLKLSLKAKQSIETIFKLNS